MDVFARLTFHNCRVAMLVPLSTSRGKSYVQYTCRQRKPTEVITDQPNDFSGFDFFFPPLPPPTPRPPLPLPRPRPPPRAPFLLNGTNPTSPDGVACLSSLCVDASAPGTGAILGRRYLGICFMCDCTRVGCNGLSCRKYSKSRGLSSKCAYNPHNERTVPLQKAHENQTIP